MNDILPPGPPARSAMIKGLAPQLPERGKIKIGMKGKEMTSKAGNKFQPPMKLDHFLITTMTRTDDGNFKRDEAIHQRFGDKPTELPIRLLYDDPAVNFPTRYAAYNGRTLWCTGDGEQAWRLNQDGKGHHTCQCPCPLADPAYKPQTRNDAPKCKMNGSLGVLIEGAGGLGGVWKFRTTSYNSIVGLLSSMSFIRSITGGPLAGIPLKLSVAPKVGVTPDGDNVTVWVVGISYEGDVARLQQVGHQIALDRATTHMSIERIEDEARMRLLAAPIDVPLPGDDNGDIVDEYYPEQIVDREPPVPAERPRPEDYRVNTDMNGQAIPLVPAGAEPPKRRGRPPKDAAGDTALKLYDHNGVEQLVPAPEDFPLIAGEQMVEAWMNGHVAGLTGWFERNQTTLDRMPPSMTSPLVEKRQRWIATTQPRGGAAPTVQAEPAEDSDESEYA